MNMSGTITVNEKEYEVHYSEHNDVWEQRDLKISAAKLSGLKKQIQEIDKKERRVSVGIISLGGYRPEKGTLTLISADGEEGYCTMADGTKCKRALQTLAMDNEFNVAILQESIDKERKAVEDQRAAKKLRDGIPRIKIEDLTKNKC